MSPFLGQSPPHSSASSFAPKTADVDTFALPISCQCTAVNHALLVATSSPSLQKEQCACPRCRATFGTLFSSWLNLPTDVSSPLVRLLPDDGGEEVDDEDEDRDDPYLDLTSLLGSLSSFAFRVGTKLYGCPGCGATCFLCDRGKWSVASGLVDRETMRTMLERDQYMEQYPFERKDGRAVEPRVSKLFPGDGMGMACINVDHDFRDSRSNPGVFREQPTQTYQESGEVNDDWCGTVEWACACENVRGKLLRREEKWNRYAKAPRQEDPRFEGVLSSSTTEGCCTGFEIASWLAVPWQQIRFQGGLSTWLKGIKLGDRGMASQGSSIGMYRSAPGIERYWCRRCGARVLLVDRKRPGYVKVAAGLLRSQAGPMAEDWVHWEVVSSEEDSGRE